MLILERIISLFSENSDNDKVLKGGPGFIGEHFLAIKPWEPYFKASEASFSAVAVWVRLLELPIEFYDASVLREIGGAIGPVLRIDSYTTSGTRGSYARLCLQIDLTKPLITTIRVGRLKQKVMYEGISSLCFSCGRIGHKVDNCPHHIRLHTLVGDKASPSNTTEKQTPHHNDQNDHNYGEWMIVTRKRI